MAFVIVELEATGTVMNVLWNKETGPGKHWVCQEWSQCRSGLREGHMQNHHHLVGWPEYWQEN